MILNLSPINGVWMFLAQASEGDFWDQPAMFENWQVISSFLLPLVMAFIIQSNWSRGVQALATFVVAVLWTIIKESIGGAFDNLDPAYIIPTAMKIFALAIPFYYGLYKPTGVSQGIEAVTNFTPQAKAAADRKFA